VDGRFGVDRADGADRVRDMAFADVAFVPVAFDDVRLAGAPLADAWRAPAAVPVRRAGVVARFGTFPVDTRRVRLGVVARPVGRDGDAAFRPLVVLGLAWSRSLTWRDSGRTGRHHP